MIGVIGLAVNFIAAIILLAANVRFIEKLVKRFDPIHYAYSRGLGLIQRESIEDLDSEENRAYPYDDVVESNWRLWPLLKFVDRHVEQDVPRNCVVDIRGGWFKINGEQLKLAGDRRIVEVPDDYYGNEVSLNTGGKASLSAILGLVYEARRKRIYLWGALGLTLGFGLQLVDAVVF